MIEISFSLELVDGDIAQRGTTLGLVFGKDKLIQDLDLWLRERYGGDRFHVNMGSVLQEYIGGIISLTTKREVQSEVLRILQNYQAVQLRGLRENPQKYSNSELLLSIQDIRAEILYDRIYVSVVIRNGSGDVATVSASTGIL